MLKLFAVVLGGRANGCNTELHDVVFTVNETIQQAYPALVNKWFGIKKRLHIDAYIELIHADGHDIIISNDKSKDEKKLFFVNFGSYKKGYFGEIHESGFYVATSKSDVLIRAKNDLCVDGIEPHCDDNVAIDDIIEVSTIGKYNLQFVPSEQKHLDITTLYQRLDLPSILEQAIVLAG